MNLIQVLTQLRDDLKDWVTNNLVIKADKTYVEEMIAETKAESSNKDAVVLSEAQKAISTKADKTYVEEMIAEAKTDSANKDAVVLAEIQNNYCTKTETEALIESAFAQVARAEDTSF